MVRQKNRWLLVRFDFESDIISSCSLSETATAVTPKGSKKRRLRTSSTSNLSDSQSTQSILQVTSTDIYRSLQDLLVQNFGLVGASTAEVQVRLYDPKVRLAIVKTSREKYPLVRSSLTLLTQIKLGGDSLKVVASTIAVSGSARTARNAAWEEVRKIFYGQERELLGKNKEGPWSKKSRIAMEKNLQDLEDRLDKIDSGC
mmetsp:Transcript_14281/g.31056  ORF Transcript_14281/g.31056 Transcript_14281/m.31056 type:complete len:201 (+) Transcript_14281:69-671(+)|eukprot:CAMPEP_0172534658 /NCGR_PEP_ID=MMETSP1067-20121228/6938_1 /TAXON_ID=265564 ORGANISM="Thalassiosira punctigera, Strain Tpunct2005C2" /NCGR_SAMPLE_ID=MMETSP1067 /ASSEMBLY_ACC=CAM_ASM_000444 /LENGTH=200 /DNA_ID=CAMNT_0013319473 /DNA_START=68 /DNA_END=670 /DNA_ORIENTATION=-